MSQMSKISSLEKSKEDSSRKEEAELGGIRRRVEELAAGKGERGQHLRRRGAADLDEVTAKRMEELEKRLAALEKGAKGGGAHSDRVLQVPPGGDIKTKCIYCVRVGKD